MFSESKIVGPVHFNQEREDFHPAVNTLYSQLPKYRFPCRTTLPLAVLQVYTIWWPHNQ